MTLKFHLSETNSVSPLNLIWKEIMTLIIAVFIFRKWRIKWKHWPPGAQICETYQSGEQDGSFSTHTW